MRNAGAFNRPSILVDKEFEEAYARGRQSWAKDDIQKTAYAAKMVRVLVAGSAAARELTGDGKEIEGGGGSIGQKDLLEAWKYAFGFKKKNDIPAYITVEYEDVRRACRGPVGEAIVYAARRLMQRRLMHAEELKSLWEELMARPTTLPENTQNSIWKDWGKAPPKLC